MEILVERTATAHEIVTPISDTSGPVTGLTVEQSVYDAATDEWLNMTTGAWQAGKDTGVASEPQPGQYVRAVNVSQADPASHTLLALSEITAGAAGVGRVSGDVIRLVRNYKTLADENVIRAHLLSDDTAFPGAHIDAAISSISTPVIDTDGIAVAVWTKVLTGLSAPDNATAALLAAGGGNTPEAIAASVLNALTEAYQYAEGSVGQALHNMDATTLRLLMEAAIAQMSRSGRVYGSVTCQEMFIGDVGEVISRPVLINGNLADLTGATISWRFIDLETGAEVTKVGAVSGTPGHAQYTTLLGDGIIDAAVTWRAYATATLLDATTKTSERMVVKVRAVV